MDCAKLAVRRRSQEAQLYEDRGFKMKLDGFVSNISCVKCLLFYLPQKKFLEIMITCFVPHTACFLAQWGVCNNFDTKTNRQCCCVGRQKW